MSAAALFEELLEQYRPAAKRGEVVEATVGAIGTGPKRGQNYVLVEAPGVKCASLLADELPSEAELGDALRVRLLRLEDDEGLGLSSHREALLEDAWREVEGLDPQDAIEIEITHAVNAGVIGRYRGVLEAFLPAGRAACERDDVDELVGQTIRVAVIEASRERGNIIVSQIAVVRRERLKAKIAALKEGETYTVRVTNIKPFGAFVALDDRISGMIHISQIADRKLDSPADVLSVGDEVEAKLVRKEFDEKGRPRLDFSLRAIAEDAKWKRARAALKPGSVVECQVARIRDDLGAFVTPLEHPEITLLYHHSEFGPTPPRIGEKISVRVLSIDEKRRRFRIGDPSRTQRRSRRQRRRR